jgi:hypothetical protein
MSNHNSIPTPSEDVVIQAITKWKDTIDDPIPDSPTVEDIAHILANVAIADAHVVEILKEFKSTGTFLQEGAGIPLRAVRIPRFSRAFATLHGRGFGSYTRLTGLLKGQGSKHLVTNLGITPLKSTPSIFRDILEQLSASEQCINTIGDIGTRPANSQCYICGLPLKPDGEGVFAPECEHILPVAEASIFLHLYTGNNSLNESHRVKMELEYAWAHRGCNRIKNNFLFIQQVTQEDGKITFEIETNTVATKLKELYTKSWGDPSKLLPRSINRVYKDKGYDFVSARLSEGSQLNQRLTTLCKYLTILTNNNPVNAQLLEYLLQSQLTKEVAAGRLKEKATIDPKKQYETIREVENILKQMGITSIDHVPKYIHGLTRPATEALQWVCKGGVCRDPNSDFKRAKKEPELQGGGRRKTRRRRKYRKSHRNIYVH